MRAGWPAPTRSRRLRHRTNVIGDVSEFTLETAFPIPFFVKTDAVTTATKIAS